MRGFRRYGRRGGGPKLLGGAMVLSGGLLVIKISPLWIWPLGMGLWLLWAGIGPLVVGGALVWAGYRMMAAR
jgi:hypothetical protein